MMRGRRWRQVCVFDVDRCVCVCMLLACEGVQEDNALLTMRGRCWRQVCVCVLWVLPRTMCIRHGGVCVCVSCRQICMCVYAARVHGRTMRY